MTKVFNRFSTIPFIILFGFIIRLVFILFIAEPFFGRENIYVDHDTQAWQACIMNLIEHESYSLNLDHEYGYFGRMPGYSFFMGLFYFIAGQDWDLAYLLIACVQTILDVLCIYITYRISLKIFNSKRVALISSFLYATYPFIIVWNPVVYSEQISICFMLFSIFWLSNDKKKHNLIWSGIFLSLAILNRPQIALLVPFIFLIISIAHKNNLWIFIKKVLLISIPVLIIYGSWPARNYINYGKLIPTQDLRGYKTWDIDIIAFLQYIYSVKAEWEPQFSSILSNTETVFPANAYSNPNDSLMLVKAIHLSKTCGSGFSHWRGYWKEPLYEDNCNEEIATLFNTLRENQIRANALNFYIYIPIMNLKKAIFKTKLYKENSIIRTLASKLFLYRTFLILMGIIGALLMIKHSIPQGYLFFLFFITLYFTLCFGTSVQFRNIEMRYFLPADVLLIFPASYFLFYLARVIKPES